MNKFTKIFSKIFLWLILLIPVISFAEGEGDDIPAGRGTTPVVNDVTIPNPFKLGSTLYEFIRAFITEIIMPIGSVVAVVFIIYAGFKYVKARGNPEEIKKAHQTFLWTAVGVAVLLGAWVIATAIEGTINQLTLP